MEAVARVIRHTPVTGLRRYFNERFEEGEALVDWQGNETIVTRRLLKVFSELDSERLAPVAMDFDRVFEMTDEPGQDAIAGVISNQEWMHTLENAYDRAMWMFLDDANGFRRAEEVRFAEHYRKGQKWTGFVGPKGLKVSYDSEHRREFEARICDLFKSTNAQVDLYDRFRFGLDEQPAPVTQAVVYRKGFPDSRLAFNDGGDLEHQPTHPVLEAVITYDSKSGVIEVVGLDAKSRSPLVRLFAEVLLRQEILGIRLPMRQYDLSSLMQPRTFPTDPEDGIASVKVLRLEIQLKKYPGLWMALRRRRDIETTLYEYSEAPFGDKSPLRLKDVEIVQAELAVRFRPDQGSRNGKIITLKITLPNGCDLKGRTEKERLICEKYLPLWGLIQED